MSSSQVGDTVSVENYAEEADASKGTRVIAVNIDPLISSGPNLRRIDRFSAQFLEKAGEFLWKWTREDER